MSNIQGTAESKKRYFALKNHEDNDKAVKRYFLLVREGKSDEEAREIVKDAFGIGDRRLDNALATRAGQFSPKTVSELEALATRYLAKIDIDTQTLDRFYRSQLDEIDTLRQSDDHDGFYVVKLVEERGGKHGAREVKEKLPIAEAEQRLLKAIIDNDHQPLEALRKMKADTVINIQQGGGLSSMSDEELTRLIDIHRKKLKGD